MNRFGVSVAAGLLAVLAGTGCADAGGLVPAATAWPTAGTPTSEPPAAAQLRELWPEQVLMTENDYVASAAQVLDPAHGLLYALVPRKLPTVSGPWVLRAIRLSSKTSRSGGTYPVSGIALAGGSLWAYGASPAGQALISEINPRTLHTVRPEKISSSSYLGVGSVATGPAGSVWTGSGRRLLRLSVHTGAVLARATLPAGFVLDQIAASPGGTVLYASTVPVNAGGCGSPRESWRL
jgi:hypothetical protein